jgi:hypothetical protein
MRVGEHGFTAEAPHGLDDAIVLSGHEDAPKASGTGGPFIDVLHHRLAMNVGKHFTLVPCGSIPGRNYANHIHA